MANNQWHGIMRIMTIQHVRNGRVIWEAQDIPNTLHYLGEEFILSRMFTDEDIPANYYIGLDNRTDIAASDTIDDLVDEPVGNGYLRQAASSTSDFTIDVVGGVHRAVGPVLTFSATGAGWGPVKNIFMSDKTNNTGVLIGSAELTNPVTLSAGDSINMRMSMSLRNYT